MGEQTGFHQQVGNGEAGRREAGDGEASLVGGWSQGRAVGRTECWDWRGLGLDLGLSFSGELCSVCGE